MRELNQKQVNLVSAGYREAPPFIFAGMSISVGICCSLLTMMVTHSIDGCINFGIPRHHYKYHAAGMAISFLATSWLAYQSLEFAFEQNGI